MEKRFKIGDVVTLVDSTGMFLIELRKSYIVVQTTMTHDEQFISLEGVENDPDDYHKYPVFNSRRFKKSLKDLRKKKLDTIYENKEVENLRKSKLEKLWK